MKKDNYKIGNMPLDTIEKSDILNWNSKEDIADTLKKRGLERTNLGEEDEIVMELDEDRFVAIVSASGERTPSDYNSRMNQSRQTQVVSTDDFEEFTFTTRRRAWDKHGQIKYNRWEITKEQFENNNEVRTPLDKLNNIEYGEPQSINQLYETKKVVNEFYDQFEKIRADMVEKVSGIPDDEGEKKQNYAQTIFDRLIFLHFIQEKKLLDYNPNYLEENHDEVIDEGGDVYDDFYKPLFFKWLATDTDHPEDKLPYLNGGLFTRTDIEREYEDVRLGENTEETNKLYSEILDFLGDWNWHADERLDIVDPNKLSPELLGHIFEKTVNQKEMGAYYTPEEITHFMSRNTIQPYILDRINEEFDTDYEEIDEVFKIPDEVEEESEDEVIIGPVDEIEKEEVEYLYFEVLQDLKVLDPAVGSGAFLLAAQEVMIDIYMSALQYFEDLDEEASWEMTERIEKVVTEVEENAGEEGTSAKKSMHAKRQIILNNLYGVDIDKGATEICKLRLWLSIVADLEKGDDPHTVETLPNIDFNIRQGNSLIGFTEPIEKALKDEDKDMGDAQANLNQYRPDAIHKKYNDIIQKIKTYKKHEKEGNGEKAEKARQEAFRLLEKYREDPDEKILQQFHEAGIEDVDMDDIKEFSPFHWVLEFAEVYSEGGFDVIIGNPPWDRLKPLRDDFFVKYDEKFRQRMPEDKDEKQEELLENENIAQGWEEYKENMRSRGTYFKESSSYSLQTPKIDGRKVGDGGNDLSSLFLERTFDLCSDDGFIAQILPGSIYNGASGKDLRQELLNHKDLRTLTIFENRGIFEGLHNQYKFGVSVLRNSGNTREVYGKYEVGNVQILRDLESNAFEIPRSVLSNYSPEAKIFPFIDSKIELDVLKKVLEHEPLSKQGSDWYADPYWELNRTSDRDRFLEEKNKGDYPVLGGSNIYQYSHNPKFYDIEEPKFWSVEEDEEKSAKYRIREKNKKKLKKRIYQDLDGSGSQKSFVNDFLKKKRGEKLKAEDVKLDCSEYRIVFRDVARSTDERTLIASLIPKDVVCHNTLHTVRPFEIDAKNKTLDGKTLHNLYDRIFSDKELLIALGLLNSLPLDFLMRTKIDTHISKYKFAESQVPKLTKGDNWFNYISERAAKLNCYGPEFEEMRERLGGINAATEKDERKRLQAEIDAAAFHAYGLDRDETKYVLENFHTVDNPRMMTEDYFDMVLEKFDELDEEGPLE